MLQNTKKNITLTAESVISVTEGDTAKQVSVEGYSCSIDSGNPDDIRISRWFQGTEAKKVYKERRGECHADYAAFENAAYALQDGMIAEKNAQGGQNAGTAL